jgi:lysophospholipase L1-like esterase
MDRHSMRNLFLIAYVVCLHLALVTVLVKSDFIQRVAVKLGRPRMTRAEHYERMLRFHRRIDAIVPDNAVLFIGDSFIQSLCVSAITDKAVNFGIGGDTTAGILRRLPLYACLRKARAIVLAVGGNDLREANDDQILQNYEEILSIIPNNVVVLCCSILPRDERDGSELFNRRIVSLNRSLERMCSSMGNRRFVDLTESVKDPQGNLVRNYYEADGVHLNGSGYRICVEVLSTWLTQVQGQKMG